MYTFHCRRLLLEKFLGEEAKQDVENPTSELELIANMGLDKKDITDDMLEILKKNTDIFVAPLLGAMVSEIKPKFRQRVFKAMMAAFRDQVSNDYWARDTAETMAEYVAGFFPYNKAQEMLGGKEAVEQMFIKPEDVRKAEEARMQKEGEGYTEEELEDVGEPEFEMDALRKQFDLPSLIGRRPGRTTETEPIGEKPAEKEEPKKKKPETEVGFEEQIARELQMGMKMQAIVEDVLGKEAIHFEIRPFGSTIELVPDGIQSFSSLKKLDPELTKAGLKVIKREKGVTSYTLAD